MLFDCVIDKSNCSNTSEEIELLNEKHELYNFVKENSEKYKWLSNKKEEIEKIKTGCLSSGENPKKAILLHSLLEELDIDENCLVYNKEILSLIDAKENDDRNFKNAMDKQSIANLKSNMVIPFACNENTNNYKYVDLKEKPIVFLHGEKEALDGFIRNAISSLSIQNNKENIKYVLINTLHDPEYEIYQDFEALYWPIITDSKIAKLLLCKIITMLNESHLKNKGQHLIVVINEIDDIEKTVFDGCVQTLRKNQLLLKYSNIHFVVMSKKEWPAYYFGKNCEDIRLDQEPQQILLSRQSAREIIREIYNNKPKYDDYYSIIEKTLKWQTK